MFNLMTELCFLSRHAKFARVLGLGCKINIVCGVFLDYFVADNVDNQFDMIIESWCLCMKILRKFKSLKLRLWFIGIDNLRLNLLRFLLDLDLTSLDRFMFTQLSYVNMKWFRLVRTILNSTHW